MDKNAIKKYAVWARRELISRVSQKAAQYEITIDGYGDQNATSVHGHILTVDEKKQRSALISQIKEKGYTQVMEEIAYTWFNRFSALRFMEVNGYLPTRVRVFTDDENNFKPQILTEAINMELDGLDMQKVYALKNANDEDALFKYMIIVQCNALSKILPGMFQRISDYTELLFPDNLLREGSVVEQMIAMIPQEDWTDQVEIIGWLYQYYIAEPKDERINARKQYKDEDIPFVTQLFTSDWIVRFMTENSLGRLWLKGHPNKTLKSEWRFYLEDAEQDFKEQVALSEIKDASSLKPEDILVIDPCQGSGHILAYVFDVLVQIYEAYGYSAREAASSIVEHNIWGLDIDERAAQLAYFSVMMKARQYDRRFFSRGIQPHVYAILESNNLDPHCIEYFVNDRKELKSAIDALVKELHDAKEYGSLISVSNVDFSILFARFEEIKAETTPSMYSYQAIDVLLPFVQVAHAMAQKYHAVVTNPPYMSSGFMPDKLKSYIQANYSDYKNDLFSAFSYRVLNMTLPNGHIGLLMPYTWMFIASYEKMRKYILNNTNITALVQLEYNAFEAACVPVASLTICKTKERYNGDYIKLSEFKGIENQAPKTLEAISNPCCGYRFSQNQDMFSYIPGSPIAYWASQGVINAFRQNNIGDYATAVKGLDTCDNNRFVRHWEEVDLNNIGFGRKDSSETSGIRWYPYAKGGGFRRWYGFKEVVVDWLNDGDELRNLRDERGRIKSRPQNIRYYFKTGLTWSSLTSYKLSLRFMDNSIFGGGGSAMFTDENPYYILGLVNSNVGDYFLNLLNPTINYLVSDIMAIPLVKSHEEEVVKIVKENIDLTKAEYDSFETSWDFKKHPLCRGTSIKEAFHAWEELSETRFSRLKNNEEKLNALLIETYSLQDELTCEVENRDIEVACSHANLQRDIQSLISYAVGCMFGRYSVDREGIAYAGGEWNSSKFDRFQPDKDAIIPICDDEYFEDDIVGRFVRFVEVVYGKEKLEENLRFVADALGGKGSSREVIRNYFINDFYTDHLKVYQKRPIYWLFDSGKKNGFKCLIYMHRYQPDTIARIRTDYVHEQQSRYRTAIDDLESRIANAATSERVKLTKQLNGIQAQAEELRVYEEKIHHLADQMIRISLDDGVKVNYAKFQEVLAKIK